MKYTPEHLTEVIEWLATTVEPRESPLFDELTQAAALLRKLQPQPIEGLTQVAALKDGQYFVCHPAFPPHVWDGEKMVPLDVFQMPEVVE